MRRQRKRNQEEETKSASYAIVMWVPCSTFSVGGGSDPGVPNTPFLVNGTPSFRCWRLRVLCVFVCSSSQDNEWLVYV